MIEGRLKLNIQVCVCVHVYVCVGHAVLDIHTAAAAQLQLGAAQLAAEQLHRRN